MKMSPISETFPPKTLHAYACPSSWISFSTQRIIKRMGKLFKTNSEEVLSVNSVQRTATVYDAIPAKMIHRNRNPVWNNGLINRWVDSRNRSGLSRGNW